MMLAGLGQGIMTGDQSQGTYYTTSPGGGFAQAPLRTHAEVAQSLADSQACQNAGYLMCLRPNCVSGMGLAGPACIPIWAGVGILVWFLISRSGS